MIPKTKEEKFEHAWYTRQGIYRKQTLATTKKWFDFTYLQINKDIKNRFQKSEADFTNWDYIALQGKDYFKPLMLSIYSEGIVTAAKALNVKGTWDIYNVKSVLAVDEYCSNLVTQITKETKLAINNHIAAGIKEGKSMYEIGKELRQVVGLNSIQEQSVRNFKQYLLKKYPVATKTEIKNKVDAYAKQKLIERTNMIARTETAKAQVIGFCDELKSLGKDKVKFSAYPGCCDECQELDGNIYPVDVIKGLLPKHPRCRCVPIPYLE